MPIVNFSMSAVEAKRYIKSSDKPRKIRVDHNVETVRVFPEKENVAGIEFRYTISYGHIGMIRMEGIIFYGDPDGKVVLEWQEDHKLSRNTMEEIHNYIFRNLGGYECLIIAKKLDLPPPFPPNIPRVKVEDKKGKDTKKGITYSPEIA